MEHFFSPSSGEHQKKKSSPKLEHFFSRILVDTCAQMHIQARSQTFPMEGLSWGCGGGVPSARKFCICLQT